MSTDSEPATGRVRLRATIVVEYDANPMDYLEVGGDRVTAAGMAAIDQAATSALEFVRGAGSPSVSVSVVDA